MPGTPREMITSAERRFPVRIRLFRREASANGTRRSPLGSMRLRRKRLGHDTLGDAWGP